MAKSATSSVRMLGVCVIAMLRAAAAVTVDAFETDALRRDQLEIGQPVHQARSRSRPCRS